MRKLLPQSTTAALLLGAAYIWFMVVGQRPVGGPGTTADPLVVELIGTVALFGAVGWSWIFGVERRVLAFTPAEVTFLFSGPVSRRGLIQFKLLRNQLLILFNAVLWTLILSRERFGVSSWLRVISIWVLLTTLSFHRLGASFVRTSISEHGRLGVRHRALSLLVLGAMLVLYKTRVIKVTERFRAGVLAATLAIAVVYLVALVLGLFGVRVPFLNDASPLGILISLAIVAVAALNLVLDFDLIERGARSGAPAYMEWYAAFGLLVTLVWLYLELLRLLSKLRR